MKSPLIFIFLFLLLRPDLYANLGNNSTVPLTKTLIETSSLLNSNDKSGKNIILWETQSPLGKPSPQIFTQRINESGEVLWGKSVELTCKNDRIQNSHKLIPDGKGGVIITWEERSIDNDETDIYAQHLDSLGTKLWGPQGTIISASAGSQITPMIASNGAGGAIIAWTDSRNDLSYTNWDIYAQHINAEGELMWEKDGILVSSDIKDEYLGKVLPGANGSVTIVWNKVITDISGLAEGYEFYFRKLNSKGEWIQTLNTENFLTLPVSTANYTLGNDIFSDENDGFFLSLAMNGEQMDTSLYMQHVLATGELAFTGAYGLLIDNSINDSKTINFETDSAGNIVVEWTQKDNNIIVAHTKKFNSSGNPILFDSYIDKTGEIQGLYTLIDTIMIADISTNNINTQPIQPEINLLNQEDRVLKRKAIPKKENLVVSTNYQDTSSEKDLVTKTELDTIKLTFNYIQEALSKPNYTTENIKTTTIDLLNHGQYELTINLLDIKKLNYIEPDATYKISDSLTLRPRIIPQARKVIVLPT